MAAQEYYTEIEMQIHSLATIFKLLQVHRVLSQESLSVRELGVLVGLECGVGNELGSNHWRDCQSAVTVMLASLIHHAIIAPKDTFVSVSCLSTELERPVWVELSQPSASLRHPIYFMITLAIVALCRRLPYYR